MTEFTKEQLRTFVKAFALSSDPVRAFLPAFALAQMERAENAEAERDRLKKELEEAEEAIRGLAWWFADSDGNLPPDTMPCSDPDCLACRALFGSPAVLRARKRGGRG